MLEMLRIPYTGSDPLTQALVMNKAKMQEVLAANGLPVLKSQIFKTPEQPLEAGLTYPLIVKPLAQGSSAGITSKSIVSNASELAGQVKEIISTFKEPAIVQPFLSGREFSVPMLGNPPRLLPIIEPDFSKLPKGYACLDSLEVKWIFEEQTDEHHLVCPALLNADTRLKIEDIARKTWETLQIRDWCRIDMRCDQAGEIYVIDVNSPPGMIPPEISTTSYFPMAARAAGINYDALLKEVIATAGARYQPIA
jgi:D-alanine-D-alanine ligase